MSVSTYRNNECKYNIDKLEKVVYLISEDDLRNIHIDNGEAYVDSISATPLSIAVYNIALSDTDELDERYKFTHTLTFSMNGYASYRDFQGKYFAIVKTVDGVYWLVNPLFPCKVTYTYTLDGGGSHTDFTLSTISNHPTLRVHGLDHSTPYECKYKLCKFDTLSLNEKKYTVNSGSNVRYTNDGFKDIVYNKNSAKFTEEFDGNNIAHRLEFNIKFDDYKSSWHYNLLEFTENRYAAIIKTTCGKYILAGFHFGLQPSYTVTANDETTPDNIQISLVDTYDNGYFIGYVDTLNIIYDDNVGFEYTVEYGGWECVGTNTARYLLKKEVDAFGNPTGRFMCLEGYENYFTEQGLNIVGTFSTTETFANPQCGGAGCMFQSSFPNSFVFNNVTCRTYTVLCDSDWSITSSANHITVSPSAGLANQSYTVQVCNTLAPTATEVISNLLVNYCSGLTKTYEVSVTQGNSCFPNGSVFDISANGQYVRVPTQCCIQAVTESTHTIANIVIQNTYFSVYVPQNNTGVARTFTLTVLFCNGTTAEVIINQGNGFERWVKESTACTGNLKCDVERKYTGTTASDINTRTNETRMTNCVPSPDCGGVMKRWIDSTETTCSGGRKYYVQYEQSSTDGGATWVNTGNKRLGAETPDSPAECSGTVTYEKWVNVDGEYICEETTKYNKLQLYISTDNVNWVATQVFKRGTTVLEYNSPDCGYVHGSDDWLCEKWEIDTEGWICEDTTKYAREQRFVRDCSDCNNCSAEWIPLGVYRRTEIVLETDSSDCGYDPSISGNCVEWRNDGDYICDAYDKYVYLRKYVRDCQDCNNCSASWIQTNIYKRGALIEVKSFDCGYIPTEVYYEWRDAGTMCDGYNKYQRLRKYISDDGNRWYETNIYKRGALIEANSADCGYVEPIVYEYRWLLTTQTICVGYNKYYLYKRQRRIENSGSAWEDVIPTETSYNGNGTMQPQLIEADSPDCGYTPPVEPQYKWVLLDASNYICDECGESGSTSYRYVTINTYCDGYDKYITQKKQKSTDGGITWTDVVPEETQNVLVEKNSEDCGYVNIKFSATYVGGGTYSAECNSSTVLTPAIVKQGDYTHMLTAEIGGCVESIADSSFTNIATLSSVIIGSNVTNIGDYAFENCTSLTSITIPSKVTLIETYAFAGCNSLASVTFESGSSLTYIMHNAFEHCNYLGGINIPNNITTIDSYAFANCATLSSVTIGNGIRHIYDSCFRSCYDLDSVYIYAITPPSLGGNVFLNTNENLVIYVPSASLNLYKTAAGWSDYSARIQAIL